MNERNIITGVLIALAIIVLYLIVMDPSMYATEIRARNGEVYNVQDRFKNKKEAANLIAKLNKQIMAFLAYLKEKYKINTLDDETFPDDKLRGIVKRILRNYNPEVIVENDPHLSNDTSYTIAKGRQLYICLRSKLNPDKLHDVSLLMFILLHELSHMGTITYGHNDEFWETFKFVLHEAALSGVYHPVNYNRQAMRYCGLNVDYNPYYDRTLRSIWL